MRLTIALLAAFGSLAGQSSTVTSLTDPPPGSNTLLLVTLGLTDAEPMDWSGRLDVESGTLLALVGREFRTGDVVHPPNRWEAWSREGFAIAKRLMYEEYFSTPEDQRILEPSFYVFLRSGPHTDVTVRTRQGEFRFSISNLALGETREYLAGHATVQRTPAVSLVGRPRPADRMRRPDHDFPAVSVSDDGTVWVSWQAYTGAADDVYVQSGDGESIRLRQDADVHRTEIAHDGDGRTWVVWAERLSDNWDLYARVFDGESWSAAERLTSAPQPDLQHRIATDPDGEVHLVWQGFRMGTARIFHRTYSPIDGWSDPMQVSTGSGNCWEPSVVATDDGVFVAWDQYGPLGYDVRLRARLLGTWKDVVPIAESPRFEAHVAMAADPAGRIWLAWDEAGPNWGKDFGYPRDITLPGEGLYQRRDIRMAVWNKGQLFEPTTQLSATLPADIHNFYELPTLAAEASGRVWAFFRHRTNYEVNNPARVPSHYALWEIYASSYEGGQWSPMMLVPYSSGNHDMRMRASPLPGGGLVAVWPTDRRSFKDFGTLQPDIFMARLPHREATAAMAPFRPLDRRSLDAASVHAAELADVARVRAYRYRIGSETLKILRGDMHRHTEFSWDGQNDGSLQDAYRYAIDAAAFDYIAVTEHVWGARHEYDWWRTQKAADLHRVGQAFVPLFGYERSVGYPNGHRNVIFDYRGVPDLDIQGHEIRPYGARLHGAERLYAYLRRYGGIAMSHTSATNMGTDWRDWDREVEPVVEIYQSDRNSYESVGAWRTADAEDVRTQHGGYQPDGMVATAWSKGIRIGVQASSDHMATHSSYAMVLAEENTRASLLDAIRARRTYAATDNIIVDFRLVGPTRDHLMGEEVHVEGPPRFRIHVEGTAPIRDLEVLRNNEVVLARQPSSAVADLEYQDSDRPANAPAFYYIRLRQQDQDGQLAWSSPIWVE